MKKIILATLLIAACNAAFANFVHTGTWRWRKDDGTETTATWLADLKTPIVATNTTDNLRLRFEMYNISTSEVADVANAELRYSTDPSLIDDQWIHVPAAGGLSNEAFSLSLSPTVHDGDVTTQQLAFPGYTFQGGKIITFTDYLDKADVAIGHQTEYEFCIKPTSFVLPNQVYYFKLVAQADLTGSETYPSLTTSANILPVNLASFTAQSLGQSVKLQWTTANEQNNDRFDILRSADGKTNWQVISSVKGKGNSSQLSTYTYTDNNPINGSNFYRLKQYDLDGKFTESDVRSLLMQLSKSLLNVFPNPSKGAINFTLSEFKGTNFTVFLTDMNGKIVHREIITASANNTYKLNLKNPPAPGLYVLNIKAAGFEKSTQVMIQ